MKKVSLAKEFTKVMKNYKHKKDGYLYTLENLEIVEKAIEDIKAIEGLELSIVHDYNNKEVQIVNRKNANGFRVIQY